MCFTQYGCDTRGTRGRTHSGKCWVTNKPRLQYTKITTFYSRLMLYTCKNIIILKVHAHHHAAHQTRQQRRLLALPCRRCAALQPWAPPCNLGRYLATLGATLQPWTLVCNLGRYLATLGAGYGAHPHYLADGLPLLPHGCCFLATLPSVTPWPKGNHLESHFVQFSSAPLSSIIVFKV